MTAGKHADHEVTWEQENELEMERRAEQFMAADAWAHRQGRLAGWLRAHRMFEQERLINQAATRALWHNWKGIARRDLVVTYKTSRQIAVQEVRRAREAEVHH